jgi:hypothetical protein
VNEENVEGADAANEEAEAVGQMIGELFGGITDVLKSQEAMREVQNVLLLRLGEVVIRLCYKAGLPYEAKQLGDAFGMAAAVLNANKEINESNSEESK